tara:strand:+ start:752 stop:1477 length:726 start_codon:yes stop_codon:yes gene_type:complete
MLVAIPSKGRAGKTKSQKIIPSAFMFVPELEFEAYQVTGSKNLIAVPNNIKGITKTRNFIIKYCEKNNIKNLVFIDDDVKRAGYIQLYERKAKYKPMQEKEILKEWQKLFEITEQLSFRIWGTSTESSPRNVWPYKPFLFRTYVTASCMGMIIDGKTYFDENYPVKEDYEICLRCIIEDGGVVGARYFFWENSHWQDDGGCKDYRTQEMEKNCIKRLQKQYPGMVNYAKDRKNKFCIKLNL